MIEQVYKDRERFDVVPQKESFQLSIDMLIKFIDALDVVETGNCLARATHLVLSDETCTLLHSWGVDKVTRAMMKVRVTRQVVSLTMSCPSAVLPSTRIISIME